jgi:2',3'-cyclic-nucleotide 2'-phosphodiesterase (5'-nucleotidase family)
VIGYAGVDLEARTSESRTKETNLGNLICDIVRTEHDADIGLIGSGSLRLDEIIPKGPLKLEFLYAL